MSGAWCGISLDKQPLQNHHHYKTAQPAQLHSLHNGVQSKLILSFLFIKSPAPIPIPVLLTIPTYHIYTVFCMYVSYVYKNFHIKLPLHI